GAAVWRAARVITQRPVHERWAGRSRSSVPSRFPEAPVACFPFNDQPDGGEQVRARRVTGGAAASAAVHIDGWNKRLRGALLAWAPAAAIVWTSFQEPEHEH